MKKAGTGAKSALPAFFILLSFSIAAYFLIDNSDPQASSSSEPGLLALNGHTMGTQYQILLHNLAVPDQGAKAALEHTISEKLRFLDKVVFSTYASDSELSRLNQIEAESFIGVSNELLTVLLQAREVYLQSSGAFDVTIKPLVDLWGFGDTNVLPDVPQREVIALAKAQLGMTALEINQQGDSGAVKKHKPVFIDLSAIAKGYAVDQLGQLLETLGHNNYLVEIGGEISSLGKHPDGRFWRIGIERPEAGQKLLFQQIRNGAEKLAVATSGNYQNFFIHEGQQYSHIINPVTAWPISSELRSVTVVASSAMTADAWATALHVSGLEEGIRLANDLQLAAFFIVDSSKGFKAYHSDAFSPYL